MLKSKFIATLLIVLSFVFLFGISISFANGDETVGAGDGDCEGTNCNTVSLDNPLGGEDGKKVSVNTIIARVINAVLGVIGSLALLMFVFGGITWMTSSGSPEKVKKGRDIIIWSVIGLAVIFFSYALVNFVIFDIIGG